MFSTRPENLNKKHTVKHICYEQPLNERIRTVLRLEHLFRQAAYWLTGDSIWHSRAVLDTLFDIQNVFGRADLRSELIKELERHAANLGKLVNNPNVDSTALNTILDDLDVLVDRLHAINGQLGKKLRDNEFLNSIRQRSSIAGGDCAFDLPAYHQWLQYPAEQRTANLNEWMSEFNSIRDAVFMILSLIRDSATAAPQVAEGGFYQQSLDTNIAYQLIRVIVPDDQACFAEISAGKHRFTLRFMQLGDLSSRATQCEQDIQFHLACCVL